MPYKRYMQFQCVRKECRRKFAVDKQQLTENSDFSCTCECGQRYEWTGKRLRAVGAPRVVRMVQAR